MVVHSAYCLINNSIPDTGGPFTVKFYDDDGVLIQTDANVPKYGTAHCTLLDGTIVNGLYFKGWNPSPSAVTRDLECYPVRGDYIIDINETHDTWETICADDGAHYPLGTYKSLVINVPARQAGDTPYVWNTTTGEKFNTGTGLAHGSFQVALDMVKVAEGEDGSTSSWLSTGLIPINPTWYDGSPNFSSNVTAYQCAANFTEGGSLTYTPVHTDWGNSVFREYLNNFFISQLPAVVAAKVKEVTKEYASYVRCPIHVWNGGVGSNYGDAKVYKSSLDKIWIPSAKELHSYFSDKSSWGGFSGSEEPTGIDYSAVYMPTYSNAHLTRTLYIGANYINCLTVSGSSPKSVDVITAGCPGTPFGFCL